MNDSISPDRIMLWTALLVCGASCGASVVSTILMLWREKQNKEEAREKSARAQEEARDVVARAQEEARDVVARAKEQARREVEAGSDRL